MDYSGSEWTLFHSESPSTRCRSQVGLAVLEIQSQLGVEESYRFSIIVLNQYII